MARFTCPVAICALLFIGALVSAGGESGSELLGWMPSSSASGSACTGTIAECLAGGGIDDDEFAMGSEVERRILYATRYISYAALRRNNVPCSRRGQSYYLCRPGRKANPYSRGCSIITRCRR